MTIYFSTFLSAFDLPNPHPPSKAKHLSYGHAQEEHRSNTINLKSRYKKVGVLPIRRVYFDLFRSLLCQSAYATHYVYYNKSQSFYTFTACPLSTFVWFSRRISKHERKVIKSLLIFPESRKHDMKVPRLRTVTSQEAYSQ